MIASETRANLEGFLDHQVLSLPFAAKLSENTLDDAAVSMIGGAWAMPPVRNGILDYATRLLDGGEALSLTTPPTEALSAGLTAEDWFKIADFIMQSLSLFKSFFGKRG